jgi:hypothetical protein
MDPEAGVPKAELTKTGFEGEVKGSDEWKVQRHSTFIIGGLVDALKRVFPKQKPPTETIPVELSKDYNLGNPLEINKSPSI